MTLVPLDRSRLNAALDLLRIQDADLGRALARIGYPAPRMRDEGFGTLLQIVTAQQLSTRSAAAIWQRLETRLEGKLEPASLLAVSAEDLRALGFSRQKIGYAHGLARAVLDGDLPVDRLASMADEAVIEAITALKGFGRWSAEIYLLFALGRIDAFPADDLAIQIGWQRLKGLDDRPGPKALRAMTEILAPHRGAAAIFLWHYYGAATLDRG